MSDAAPIDVVLMRHGEAQALSYQDAARPLTQWGREAVRAVALELAKKAPSAQGVRSSPYLRARQSAEIVAEVLAVPVLADAVELVPTGDFDQEVDGSRGVPETRQYFWPEIVSGRTNQ